MANVSLILLDDVEHLGLAGEEVRVAAGYARNYLIPKKLAAKATPGTLRLIESRKAAIAARRAADLAAAKELAEKLATVEISIAMQATEDDQLFGSVTSRMVAEELKNQGYAIEHSRITIEPAIKTLGSFTADVKLHAEVMASVKIWVVRG
ncbi:MAG: 50S ribosomal protein L9 [Lentisphaeria bacterium]|nr:50S ribosomal protein L9 [Lentisphaeria bacterium]MBR2719891.1 50S ribosomal protein L9 [Lentisphaeria bacterium]